MRSVTGLATADGLRAARVNGELEAKDSFADAGFVEDVPILLYHHFNFTARCQSNMGADADMLLELGLVPGTVPEVDVGAQGGDGSWNTANRIAILGEVKKVVVDVVPIVERDVTIGRLRAPDFGRTSIMRECDKVVAYEEAELVTWQWWRLKTGIRCSPTSPDEGASAASRGDRCSPTSPDEGASAAARSGRVGSCQFSERCR